MRISLIELILLLFALATANGSDMTTSYLKPAVSSEACMDTVVLIAAKTERLGNDGACMQCDPANKVRRTLLTGIWDVRVLLLYIDATPDVPRVHGAIEFTPGGTREVEA